MRSPSTSSRTTISKSVCFKNTTSGQNPFEDGWVIGFPSCSGVISKFTSLLTIKMMMNERVVKCFNSFFCPEEVGEGGWGDRRCISSCGSSRVLLHVWVRQSEARGPHFTIPSKHNLQHLGPTANSGLYRRWTSPQHVCFAHGNYVVIVSRVLEIVGTSRRCSMFAFPRCFSSRPVVSMVT